MKNWTTSKFGHVSGKEDIALKMSAPCGLHFVVTERVDVDHAGDIVTRQSRKGIMIYVNSALVYWMSNKYTN